MWELALFTAYHGLCAGCSGIMFSGLPADHEKNYIAADLRYWDIGDQIEIRFPDNSIKIYTIADTGGAIRGKWRFDILVASKKLAIDWGTQDLWVREL